MPPETTDQAAPPSEEFDIDDMSNPFITEGELNDIDEEAANRLFAESIGSDSQAPTKEPAAQVFNEGDSEPGELKGLENLEKGGEAAPEDAAPQAKPDEKPSDDMAGMFSKPAPKKTGKGLRSQTRELAQQREELQKQLEEKDRQLAQIQEQLTKTAEERETYQKAVASQYEVGPYSPNTDPEIQEIDNKIDLALKKSYVNLGPDHGPLFEKHHAALVDHYNKALQSGNVHDYYKFLEQNFPNSVDKAQAEISRLSDLLAERGDKEAHNRSNYFQTSIGHWEEKQKSVMESVNDLGRMDLEEAHKAMSSDETSANAIISLVAQNYPAFGKVLDDIRARTTTFVSGIRPFDIRDKRWQNYLDPVDPSRLSPEGEKIMQAEIYNHKRSQELLPQRLATGEAASQLLPLLAKRIADLENRLGLEQGSEHEPDLSPDSDDEFGGKGFTITEEQLEDHDKLENPYLDDI